MKRTPITLRDLEGVSWQIAHAEGWSDTKEEIAAQEAADRNDFEAEWFAENAYVISQENKWDAEAQADLALHEFLHPEGYGR